MRFLRRNNARKSESDAAETAVDVDESGESDVPKGYTPGKGRPTPKRVEAEGKRRGPVAPPPTTTREAIRRNRELKKQNPVTKEDKEARRAAARERREKMMAGDERYLLPRDRGPVKAYVRDLIDARRNILGLFMPLAVLVFLSLLVPIVAIQQYATLFTTIFLLGMLVEGFINGRRVAKAARERFPNETIRGASLGWYAFVRASQLRRLRVPKPRLKAGDPIP
ncbi:MULTISPECIES: DUF3043 domain-containing protein [Prauserella salsuginis group]|uniref:DUF3043 domain-containing protein n=2 Tax=Prauserella salsuginis group TaxID=2893672 RepID=A0A839XFK7_9PSEU|nr:MULTISPECIES: DUF3043 domain-containing protein [Prauserella salsuginis group]MBB3661207.1 hypothetical protein [Prauserella sediminis]MCR3719068.1 Protein of unknown function (DUF3043) [Prauserella flava]MCR3733638.1 Protein of unknown function (DUF3043) [Prauserella salsuginis]